MVDNAASSGDFVDATIELNHGGVPMPVMGFGTSGVTDAE